MEDKIEKNKAYKEAYVVLNELKLYDKISPELKEIIESNMDKNHNFSFDKNIPLFNQVDNNVTRNLLTYIYAVYINRNENYNEYFLDLDFLK